MTNIANRAETHAAHHARRLTADLRRHAWESGWPTHLARRLYVHYDEDGYTVKFPAHLADEIHTTEFGSQDTPPSPVITRFVNRLDHHSHSLDKEFESLAHEVGIL